uniref:Bulb-type lectin domain-containing protein n=1 Tax=Neogobius melanostomus TaxID=47308 RepID=A0A8C6TTF0_9GOBI
MSRTSISTNQELRCGEFIESLNGEYYAIMQHDSNMVVYKRDHGPVWATGTNQCSGTRLVVQSDGDLVLFNSEKSVVWHSCSHVEPLSSTMRLTMCNNGELCLDNDGDTIWSSRANVEEKKK